VKWLSLKKRRNFNAFDKLGDLDEQQAIAHETIVRLSDMNYKHAKGIQLLDKILLLPSLSTIQVERAPRS
jgi:hypothetical protein